jgi:tetratricopeptide (TPR) repeat protein
MGDRAIKANPNDARGYALKANAMVWSDPGNAVPIAIQARNLDPNFGEAYAAMAIGYTLLGRYSLALENGQTGLRVDPDNPDVYRAYVWPLIYTGHYDQVVQVLETAISLNPNLTGPYFQLAAEYKDHLSQPEMAAAIYDHIIQMNVSPDDNAKANLRICETFNAAARAQFELAEPYCLEAIEIKPDYGSAYRELGRMRYKRRNYEGAIEAFETCVALGATDIECWGLRGLALYWMGRCDEAWDVLNQAAVRARQQDEGQGTVDDIDTGLYNITQKCDGYRDVPTPTVVQPTAIPPTPIGGL